MAEDIFIHVDNRPGVGADTNPDPGPSTPLATADEAFRRLPPSWRGRAEIRFANTGREYPIIKSSVCFGTPIGPDASPLVIRGDYDDLLVITATGGSGDNVVTGTEIAEDELVGKVLVRLTGSDSRPGTAVSIRGNRSVGGTTEISLQQTIGAIATGDTFKVQRPAVTLVPRTVLNLTSHDARSPNFTLIGIKIAPAVGAGLALLNIRAQCDTCEFAFQTTPNFVHTGARINGGLESPTLSPELPRERSLAGAYFHSTNAAHLLVVIRNGILGGHLTFKTITVRVSQGGAFVPQTLEALAAPLEILTGGTAFSQSGWGTATNKARIRNVVGSDGLRVFNGGSLHSPLAPINLDIFGCEGDGIRLDMGSTASFGKPGEDAGLVTTGAPNQGFGMNVRNASRALVGRDAATQKLDGVQGQVALDDGLVGEERFTWERLVNSFRRKSNAGLSLVRVNT